MICCIFACFVMFVSGDFIRNISIINTPVSWQTAQNFCESRGEQLLPFDDDAANLFYLSLHLNQWTLQIDPWIGAVKPHMDCQWYSENGCQALNGSIHNINGDLRNHRQCMTVNIAGLKDEPVVWQADNCDDLRPFACEKYTDINHTFINFTNHQIRNHPVGYETFVRVDTTFDDCKVKCSSYWNFYAGEWREGNMCTCYFTDLNQFPVFLNLTLSETNTIIFMQESNDNYTFQTLDVVNINVSIENTTCFDPNLDVSRSPISVLSNMIENRFCSSLLSTDTYQTMQAGYILGSKVMQFTLVNTPTTWMDALETCEDNGLGNLLISDPNTMLRFRHAYRLNESILTDPWINYIKPYRNRTWLNGDTCTEMTTTTILNVSQEVPQCLVLNMSDHRDPIDGTWYADDCNQKRTFGCLLVSSKGRRNKHFSNVDFDETQFSKSTTNNISSDTCFQRCENHVDCLLVKYLRDTKTCTNYSFVSMLENHFEFNLTYSKENNSVFIKTTQDTFEMTNISISDRTWAQEDLNCFIHTTTAPTTTTSSPDLEARIENLKAATSVNQKTLSAYKNKFISAPDNRPSSKAIGYTGMMVIAILVGLVFVSDLPRFASHFKMLSQLHKKYRSFRKKVPK